MRKQKGEVFLLEMNAQKHHICTDGINKRLRLKINELIDVKEQIS